MVQTLRIVRWLDSILRIARSSRATFPLFLVVALGVFTLYAWWVLTPTQALQAGPRIVEIAPNQGTFDIADTLAEAQVIRSRLAFSLLSLLRDSVRSLKAGEYEIPRDTNALQILALLEQGRTRKHRIVFFEGDTVRDLARLLEAEGLARAPEVERLARDPIFLRDVGIEAPSLEGYLFPDTYYFFKGLAVQHMLGQMANRLREIVTPDLLAQAAAKGLTRHKLLTLASIIEKEGVMYKEFPLISAVFWNRMKRKMPLQADPTVQYAVDKEWRALTRADLRVDSPFNTYRYRGLPPAPIANPGKAAILAALNPAKVNYLYFVSLDGRRHIFSRTLREHHAAVARSRLARAR